MHFLLLLLLTLWQDRYWAWQRTTSMSSPLARNNVKIYLSPSTVPGEGEVKLLDWIYSRIGSSTGKRSKGVDGGESIAIMGGDSDLVLESLLIPPSSTHNVFCILPDGARRNLVVSTWEMTRRLHSQYFAFKDNLHHYNKNIQNHSNSSSMAMQTMMNIRTDLVLLLILNGNDVSTHGGHLVVAVVVCVCIGIFLTSFFFHPVFCLRTMVHLLSIHFTCSICPSFVARRGLADFFIPIFAYIRSGINMELLKTKTSQGPISSIQILSVSTWTFV